MAEVNLRSWWGISQASEGLQWNSTTATWENILARLARLETRLVEHERRVAVTHSPLRPEPDPPDHPWLYTAAQPPHAPYQPMPESYHCYPSPSVANLRTTQAKPSLTSLPPPQSLLSLCETKMAKNREPVNPVEESESDSSEEGCSSEEESDADLDPTPPQNKPQPQIPAAKPSQPLPHPSSNDEDDSGSETESESDAPEVRLVTAGGRDDKKRKQDHVLARDDDPKPKTKKAYLLEIAKKHINVQKALEEIAEAGRDVAAARDKLAALLHKFDTEEFDMDERRRSAIRCAFDPGGDVSQQFLAFNSRRCIVISTLRTRWISTVGELIRVYLRKYLPYLYYYIIISFPYICYLIHQVRLFIGVL